MTKETAGERVIKKIGSSHVIWFPESNRWVEFKEPAWYVYRKHESGETEPDISRKLVKRYRLPEDEAIRFYREIIAGIEHSATGNGSMATGSPSGETVSNGTSVSPFVTRGYLINNKHFTISFGSPLLEYYIHRPLAHLETSGEGLNTYMIGLFEEKVTSGRNFNLQLEEPGSGGYRHFRFEEAGFLKHRLYTAISSHIYGIGEESWMTFIHASAVTNGREAVLFSSASGSGKSTMAALLQVPGGEHLLSGNDAGNTLVKATGCGGARAGRLFFMSDDFVPVAAGNKKAYPFPAALTVKEGSFNVIEPFYDPAADADNGYDRALGSPLRYLQPRFPDKDPFSPQPVKKIIFLKHNTDVDMKLEKLDTLEALSAFHEEAWVSQNPGHARAFIDWFVTLSCYRLEYSDSGRAVKTVREIINRT